MTLRVVDGGAGQEQRQPWHQRDDEDEAEFGIFVTWLMSPRPRKPPDYPQIAMSRAWSERATAYDASTSLPASPKGQLERMLADALVVGSLEMRKLMGKVRENGDPVLSTKEVVMFMHALVDNKDALEKALGDDVEQDFSNLSDDELRDVLRAKQALAKVGRK
jgi:hypothetical protein